MKPKTRWGVLAVAALSSACSEAAETGEPDAGADAGARAWQVVLDAEDLDRAVLSVWGSSPDDVYAVGGPLGNEGLETLAVRFDGAKWSELAPGGTETYWWVAGSGPGNVWMVGEQGRITHFDGASFQEHESGVTATIWGVFAFSPSEAWAVGGTPEGGTGSQNDIVLRWDGESWAPEKLPGDPLGRAYYKVWGTSSDDLYVVGEQGTIWHRTASGWGLEADPQLAQGTLFTVHGCGPGEVYAVGGADVLRSDGQTWARQDPSLESPVVNGVACGPSGQALIVGFGGLKQRFADGAWITDFDVEPYEDLHGAWADGQGTFWAVGGDFLSKPSPGAPRKGVVARYGAGRVEDAIGP